MADGRRAPGAATTRHPEQRGAPAPPTRLEAQRLSAGYGKRAVVHDVDLVIPVGSVVALIGPNGCGKSTLLRALARLRPPLAGKVLLDGRDVGGLRSRELAKELTLLPQAPVAPEGLTVADLIARGRHPHQSWWRQWDASDEGIVRAAMEQTGVLNLAATPLDELSGGQRQRAWIAMALAQQTATLLLDEPTTHLDLAHAVEVLDLVAALRHTTGRTTLMVLHDLNLAARYADTLVVMSAGRVVASGPPRAVLTREMLADVFGLDAHVIADPRTQDPLVAPVTSR